MAKLKVKWSKHVEDKLDMELARLGVTKKLLENIGSNPDEVLFDSENGRNIAVGRRQNVAVI